MFFVGRYCRGIAVFSQLSFLLVLLIEFFFLVQTGGGDTNVFLYVENVFWLGKMSPFDPDFYP